MHANVAWDRKPGVSMIIGRRVAARLRAVFHTSTPASSTTGTPPSARSREASRAIDRCGSASIMVGVRPCKCQCTARQLAIVLLPLPPFIVATVIICRIFDLPFRYSAYGESPAADASGFLVAVLELIVVWPEYSYFCLLAASARPPPCSAAFALNIYWLRAAPHITDRTALNMSKDWTRTWQVAGGSTATLIMSPDAADCRCPLILILTLSFDGEPTSPTVNRPPATIKDWFGLMT